MIKNCVEDFTIEHILPDSESVLNGQIGNLIPLESQLNGRCKDKPLSEKIDVYKSSVYSSTRKFADRFKDRDFDPQDRTERLAKLFYKEILNLNN